ncbi:MAG: hypothetical protein JWP04_2654, partial [Belnapia sp.]|nr:hypothetical protein [Belnapia sp.]
MTAIPPASRIGLGCSRLGATLGGASGAAAEALLRHALASGIRLLDTADIYGQGDSERLIGAALREWGEGTPLRDHGTGTPLRGHGTGTPLRGRGEGVLLVTKAGQRFTP